MRILWSTEGDLEEMVEELSGGKVMYGFIQVTDPNTQLLKNVLVNWVSDVSHTHTHARAHTHTHTHTSLKDS